MGKTYKSFAELFASKDIELQREIETVRHNDENIANNRLFVWNFEEIDLEEFLGYFQVYKDSPINSASRQLLNGHLMRKMNAMLREGYNPIECMLYASKIINMKLQNDKELQEILAERIKDIYLKQESETKAVLHNIINMWTWVPQIRVVITAIGLIGDSDELLDCILLNYAEDPLYKGKVFYAFMQNKTPENLERVMKIIMNLQDTEEDAILGRVFQKEVSGFSYDAVKILAKYYENPGMSRTGQRILKKIMVNDNNFSTDTSDELYRKNLASKSRNDDLAYQDFLEDCYQKYDDEAFYLSRFSRAEIGGFLKTVLEDETLPRKSRNTAIVSMALVARKGYAPAEAVLAPFNEEKDSEYAMIAANILLQKPAYAEKLIEIFSRKKDYELSELYGILRAAGLISYSDAVELVRRALERQFRHLLETEDYERLDCLTSNMQMFWEKKLWKFFSKDLLDSIAEVLQVYAQNTTAVPPSIAVALIETIVHDWNQRVEKAMFALYKQSDNQRIQELSYKKLKARNIEAPK